MYGLREVRNTLVHLGGIASRTGCAILCIGHFTKARTKAKHRGLGNQDVYNSIPSVLNLGTVGNTHIMVHNKSNFLDTGASMAFTLQGGFRWIGEYDMTADELVSAKNPNRRKKRDEAKVFLEEQLADGAMEQNEIDDLAKEQGIKYGTLRRAADELGVECFQERRKWWWRLG